MKQKPASMPKPEENEDQVKLKPIMGIRPGVYLTVLYSFFLLAIFFLFLIFPGLKNPRAALIVKSSPEGAAVRVNDIYMGLAGNKIMVPKGTFTIDVVMPGFDDFSGIYDIPTRTFGSLFFPRRKNIEVKLRSSNPAETLALYAADFAAWSFGGDPTDSYHVPLSLSEGVYRIGAIQGIKDIEVNEQLHDVLMAASRFTATRTALRDLIRAKTLLDNKGNAPSPTALIGSINDGLLFLSQTPGSAEWLTSLLRDEAVIRSSTWANNSFQTQKDISPAFDENRSAARLEITGLRFRGVTGFMISETPVSRNSFELFLNENPQWREFQTDYRPEEINVNPAETANRDMITGITWYAAEAWCKWLTGQLPPSMSGMEVRLPTENEWEYATGRFLTLPLTQVQWFEWCADPFAPFPLKRAKNEAINMVGSPERSLRGIPAINSGETRASLPPELSSPLISFRPVITYKQD